MQSAPSGVATPLVFTAGLAGAMTDPGNLALGFIPGLGEVKAASVAGRFAQRFVQGASAGAVQSLVAEPINALASASEGDDYTLGQAVENFFMNTIAGGGLHAFGGAIRDSIAARRQQRLQQDNPQAVSDAAPEGQADIVNAAGLTPDTPPVLRDSFADAQTDLARTINTGLDDYAWQRAWSETIQPYRDSLSGQLDGQSPRIADINRQIAENEVSLQQSDQKFRDLAKQYQGQRMSRKQAEARARKDIEQIRQNTEESTARLRKEISANRDAEISRGKLRQLERGEIPDDLASLIEARAGQIKQGLQVSPLAGGVRTASERFSDANIFVRQNALRSAIRQAVDGYNPDIEDFFRLADPAERSAALNRLKMQADNQRHSDAAARAASTDAEQTIQQRGDDELRAAQEDLQSEMELAQAHFNGLENQAEINAHLAEIQAGAGDMSFAQAARAFAACMLRRAI
ncbi:TPA: hypothetical protein MBF27_003551 [Klebsiella pneumoniae]|nr:hypothetical protein [Klebsiella pneumoniae]MBG1786769.1 hypothetical protein [Klebsiella pneumoniae]HBQ0737347.1 hypothetical protein [Klebsiella pneumoniae]HBT3121154.1 hypothetical protein [Klebsiella pneumoniae]HBT7784169.1 hypothetical protein [Klebsiella pneumoniae]